MITAYIRGAMEKAHYEIVEDDHTYFGEIPEFQGVWASSPNLERCRTELEEVLENWILLRVHKQLPLPSVDGITLEISEVA